MEITIESETSYQYPPLHFFFSLLYTDSSQTLLLKWNDTKVCTMYRGVTIEFFHMEKIATINTCLMFMETKQKI